MDRGGARPDLILNTLAEDDCESHEEALLKIYVRLRPGNPPKGEGQDAVQREVLRREPLSPGQGRPVPPEPQVRPERRRERDDAAPEDFVNTMKYMLELRSGEGEVDDIDHLGNRRLRTIDELAADEMRKGSSSSAARCRSA